MPQPTRQPPRTGDDEVNRALDDFAGTGGDLADRFTAAAQAHRRLQQRLHDPGAASAGAPTDGDPDAGA